ncbi:MAG: universal stress protein [Bauldia sp.]|nr:universal stress protein [Bauldia sp.]
MPDSQPVTDILLATDLGPRCDRALLRAFSLASQWNARLHLVLVVEPSTRPTWEDNVIADRAKAEVLEIVADSPVDWRIIIRRGPVDEEVLEVARDTGCQLIIVGMAINEFLGRARPGRLVEALIRRSPVPILMVKKARSEQYRRLLALTDFSAVSEAAIVRAMSLFPGSSLSILHAYRVPFAGFLGEGTAKDVRDAANAETLAFVGGLGEKATFESPPTVRLEQGSPEVLLQSLTRSGSVDLTVIGVHPTWGMHRHSGNLAGRLLMASATDVLAVPAG